MTHSLQSLTPLAVSAIFAACATSQAPPASESAAAPVEAAAGAAPSTSSKSLYDRLGGRAAIEGVVDEMLKNVAGDARIAHRFALTDLTDLRNKLVEQICEASGGPCKYKGGDMKTVHRGQRIKSAEFDALVEDLVKALDAFKVPAQERSELLTALGSMKPAIVEE